MKQAVEGDRQLLAPCLSTYEVGNALLKGKKINLVQAAKALKFFQALPIEFVSETLTLSQDTYALAFQNGLTYYDAAFVALAQMHNAILVTDNPKHQAKVKTASVVALADYT